MRAHRLLLICVTLLKDLLEYQKLKTTHTFARVLPVKSEMAELVHILLMIFVYPLFVVK